MEKIHSYSAHIVWTGNLGAGTQNYTSYGRDFTVSIKNKPPLLGSADAAFRGDAARYNPEELLLASLSSCHMLWYLHFCADAGITVLSYSDVCSGAMAEKANGSGYFTKVLLQPAVIITDASKVEQAIHLHEKANQYCFIANSVNFPVLHKPTVQVKDGGSFTVAQI
ncbi:MAG: OsmC family peroxiredoxin [Bacteroidetes bacterium]|nr:MAG: OsmC family peroxiredoxin [Bacteroidota bacterium]